MIDISDGTSNTLLAGERPPSPDFFYGWWYSASSPVTGGAHFGVNSKRYAYDSSFSNCAPGPYAYVSGNVDNICDVFHFWSLHHGGANFALADGSVRFLSYSAAAIMPALATRAGGEVVAIAD